MSHETPSPETRSDPPPSLHRDGSNVDLGDLLALELIPRLRPEQVFTHPAHEWQRDGDKWRGGCPWHESQSGTAFYIDVPTLLWRCPACEIGGGPVQYLYRLRGGLGNSPRGRDFVAIAKELAELAGVPFPERGVSPEQQEATRKRESRRAVLEVIIDRAQAVLWSSVGDEGRAYLHTRGLTDDDIRELRLGLYDSAKDMRTSLLAAGVCGDEICDSHAVWPGMDGYVVFPWHDDLGRPLTLYGKWPVKTPPNGKPKTTALPNPKEGNKTPWERTKRTCLYFDRAIRAGHKDLVVVEGVTDAALPQVRGDTRVVACVGAQLAQQQVEAMVRHGIKSVTTALDPDSAGDKGILSCIRRLLAAGITPYVAPKLPDQMDPDEFIIAHGIDAWSEHVGAAVHGLRHIAEQIVRHHKPATDWTDQALAAVMHEAQEYARTVPVEKANDLDDFFWPEIERETHLVRPAPQPAVQVASLASDATGIHLTDMGNAQRFARDHGADVRYCHPWRKWLVWTGNRWQIDNTGEMARRARATVRAINDEARMASSAINATCDRSSNQERFKAIDEILRWANESEDARVLQRMIQLAQSEPGIPVLPDELDRDRWLLNCANGTVDLRTGELRPHTRKDLQTKLCPTAYVPDASCPRFTQFIHAIFEGDQGLIDYLQNYLGYGLTGDVSEQSFQIWWGGGANGKTTLQNAILATLGADYAGIAPVELVMETRSDQHPTLLADLLGKRLMFAAETGQGRRLNMERLKLLTGSDRIKARRMREDFWEFDPTHKLVLITNRKPEIHDPGHASWRRIRLVPFTAQFLDPDAPENVGKTIPDQRRIDRSVPKAILAEREGILAWMVQGCLAWQQRGLPVPDKVRAATVEYRDEEDVIAAFLAECCATEHAERRTGATELYSAFQEWAEILGESSMSQRRFGEALRERGFKRITSNGMKYEGIELRRDRPRKPHRDRGF
jgi:putative DNA primase/helicase